MAVTFFKNSPIVTKQNFYYDIDKSKKLFILKIIPKATQKRPKLTNYFLEKSIFDMVPKRLPSLNLYQIKVYTISYKMKKNCSQQLFFGRERLL